MQQPTNKPASRPVVPKELAGKWIAWNSQGTKIIASANDIRAARDQAVAAGEQDPIVDWVPPAHTRFVGFRSLDSPTCRLK